MKKITLFIVLFLLILFSFVLSQNGFTQITDWNSIFGGNVTAEGFYEYDGTYVTPIQKVNWNDGYGDLEGYGLNATIKLSNLYYAIKLYYQNITNFPYDISFFNNDIGYITYYELNLLNETKAGIGSCPDGYIIQNLTTNQPVCVPISVYETDPVFRSENLSLWNAIWLLNNSITHTKGDDIYLYNETQDKLTIIYFNETKLNDTIRKQTGIFEENVTINVVSGYGMAQTSLCCNGYNEILEIAVFPTNNNTNYKFYANTSISGEVIDENRKTHTGKWIIAHYGLVVIDEKINFYIFNSNNDETFRVRLRWEK